MVVVYYILSALLLLVCAAVIVMILMQKKRSGMSSAMTGMGGQSTFYEKNKGRSAEGMLEKYTKIGGAVLMLLALILNVVR